jgi:acyl-CoA synthetase (AMP-forming)/AMP-acid ligase II
MGVCFSVNDGLAGFPATFLNDPNLPCDLRIGEDGELEIRSRRAMLGYLERQTSTKASANAAENRPTSDWFPTGDLVEQRADRVFFVGRKSETINVGGQKVYPADVEQCIGGVPGVQQVRVSGMPSSLTGQLVKAEVEPVLGVDRETLRREILAACRGRLARHQSPASIEFVDHLPLSQSGKLSRSETQHAQ